MWTGLRLPIYYKAMLVAQGVHPIGGPTSQVQTGSHSLLQSASKPGCDGNYCLGEKGDDDGLHV